MNKMLSKLAKTPKPASEPGLATFSVSHKARDSTSVLGLLVSLLFELMHSGRVSKPQGECWRPLFYTSPLRQVIKHVSRKCDKG